MKGRSHHYKKYYYYLLVRTEGKKRITDKGFRKEVYFCKESELEGTVAIHYRGDSSLSVPTSHGNSKIQTRFFVRTKPSVMTEIEEKVKSITEKSSHKQYKEIISENRDGSEYVSKPRNTRQVHYQSETPLPKIFVRYMKCSKQTNGNDRGVYAIANMVSILHGVDPSSISFNVAAMRIETSVTRT